MSARDPFVHAIMIIADRVAVLICLSAIGCGVLWDGVCRFAFGPSEGLAVKLVLRVLAERAGRPVEALFGLTLIAAASGMSALSFGLFALWRRRARPNAGHLRGPQHEV